MPITINHDGDIAVINGSVTINGVPVGSGGSVPVGTNYIFVEANGTDTQNATQLQSAYDAAKLLSLSSNGALRITIIAAPGYYNFGSSPFEMDNGGIDLVSLDGNRSVIFNSLIPFGTISIIANNVFVKGVDVGTKPFNVGGSLMSLNTVVIENCRGGQQSFCVASDASGTFINCTAGSQSFGGYGLGNGASGTFINCTAGDESFGGNYASGTFINCTAGNISFGSGGTASGIFTDCIAGPSSFGWFADAPGTFTDCKGTYDCFGGGTSASGVFKKCIGDSGSFGGGLSASLTGKLFYCRLTSGTFKTVSGAGRTYYCVDGNGDPNNQ